MDTLTSMRSLVAVARFGSFSGAARELSVSTAMISKHVRQLEERLNVRLMHRTTRGVSLTDAGQVYVDHALDILGRIDEAENAVSEISESEAGSLRISSPPAFGRHVLTPMVSDYIAEHPNVNVELGLQDDEPDVVGARLDLIVRLGELRDSSLIAKKLGEARFVLCATPGLLQRLPQPITVDDLAAVNCLVDSSIQTNSSWPVHVDGKQQRIRVHSNFRSPSTEAITQAAIEGLGLAYLPYYVVYEDVLRGKLKLVESDFEQDTMPVYVLYLSRRHQAAKAQAFIHFLEAWLPERRNKVIVQQGR